MEFEMFAPILLSFIYMSFFVLQEEWNIPRAVIQRDSGESCLGIFTVSRRIIVVVFIIAYVKI
jgi:hypothetical protein